jgi:hypothetical protein
MLERCGECLACQIGYHPILCEFGSLEAYERAVKPKRKNKPKKKVAK